jgi:ABC-type Fe3+-hydroxamate transport system substrate-binding protein
VTRVVSLVPSVTETLSAWGIVPAGVTRFCERPDLLAVGGTKNPDIAAIVDLRPDVIVMDREENRREDAAALEEAGLRVHVLHVTSVSGVEPALRGLAEAVGLPGHHLFGSEPVGSLGAVAAVAVFVPIWRRPWMTINGATYGSDLLAAAGARNVFAEAESRYPELTLDEAAGRQPDLVLAPSEPYAFGERHRHDLETVAPVVFVDGKDLFWWGARTMGALARLTALLRQD